MKKINKYKSIPLDSAETLFKAAKGILSFAVILGFLLGYVTYSPTLEWICGLSGFLLLQILLYYLMKGAAKKYKLDAAYLILDIAFIGFTISSYFGFNVVSIIYLQISIFLSVIITILISICSLIWTFSIKDKMLRKGTQIYNKYDMKRIYLAGGVIGVIACVIIPIKYNSVAHLAYTGMLLLMLGFIFQYCVVTTFIKYKEAKRRLNEAKN